MNDGNIEYYPGLLYHGTDYKTLNYSQEERTNVRNLCLSISDYVYGLFVNDGFSVYSPSKYQVKRGPELGDCWDKLSRAFQKYDSRKKGSTLYQYDSLYLTGLRERAVHYAEDGFIFGEQGDVAYWLYSSAKKIWNLDEINPSMRREFALFDWYSERERIPVLLVFENVPISDLLSEKGEKAAPELFGLGLSYRLTRDSSIGIQNARIEKL